MKIIQVNAKIDRTGSLECRRATISLNPATLHILSRDLYKHPISSMIREIFINGVDAHWEAKQTRPIDIKIPSVYDSEFYIRDYGTGIPHDRFMDIYLDYGASTKRNDNEMHGGFGLGTKSPLAYADCFAVSSFIDHTKDEYLIYYDDDNTPCVDYRQSDFTEEPDGLKVTVTAHTSYDYLEFKRACVTILQRIPSYVYNIVNKEDAGITEKELIPITGNTYGPIMIYPGKGIKVIMGYVAYDLDRYAVLNYIESHAMYIDIKGVKVNFHQIFANISETFTIEINADIGTYSVHPSKEYVNITPNTVALLQQDIQHGITALYEESSEPEFIADRFKFNLTQILEDDRKDIPIKARIIKFDYYSSDIALINPQKTTYLEIIQETYMQKNAIYVAFLSPVDYSDYTGKGRKSILVPPGCSRSSTLIIIEYSSKVENLRDIFINLSEIDLSSAVEEYRNSSDSNSSSNSNTIYKRIRNAVRSMQEPTHNVLLLKVTNDKKRIGEFKRDWNSAKHNVKTLKELKRPIFWTATKYGCLQSPIDSKNIIRSLCDKYNTIPDWKKPIIIGLPATKGTKTIENAFLPLSALDDWLYKFATSDYYIRRANLSLASCRTPLIRRDIFDNICLTFGPYNWLVRLHEIVDKYNLYHFTEGNMNSVIGQRAITYHEDIKMKIPWAIAYDYSYTIVPKRFEQWIIQVINFTQQKPTGAKVKNDARHLSN